MTDYSDLVRRLQEECCHMVAAYSGTCEVSTDLLQEAKAAIEALQARLVVDDARIDACAKAIAWNCLNEKGRTECDWLRDFSERERVQYRADARAALQPALTQEIKYGTR